jgi:hypothetical protein
MQKRPPAFRPVGAREGGFPTHSRCLAEGDGRGFSPGLGGEVLGFTPATRQASTPGGRIMRGNSVYIGGHPVLAGELVQPLRYLRNLLLQRGLWRFDRKPRGSPKGQQGTLAFYLSLCLQRQKPKCVPAEWMRCSLV